MPISCEVHREQDLVVVVASGVLTLSDIRKGGVRLLADPVVGLLSQRLCDLRGVDRLEGDHDGIHALARWAWSSSTGAVRPRLAIVATRDHVFGIARVFEAYADQAGHQVAVFREMDAARAWLSSPLEASA